ncbi:hypothetical protein E1N52_19520 [Paraburkholderia guartelaensis]|uniref:Uncharacterized protein n=1 Tax=Paraburkholderia guartelaensis TaxID=2546446 RepID=A0A4R5LB86_9BURK|nr:hypothetical protein E1N52_19520 [Paraburkholderia guartelaensis]
MPEYRYFEESGYYCFCEVHEATPGVWHASVRFERKIFHTEQRTRIPGIRHKIKQDFGSSDEAMTAASVYALECAAADETEL